MKAQKITWPECKRTARKSERPMLHLGTKRTKRDIFGTFASFSGYHFLDTITKFEKHKPFTSSEENVLELKKSM